MKNEDEFCILGILIDIIVDTNILYFGIEILREFLNIDTPNITERIICFIVAIVSLVALLIISKDIYKVVIYLLNKYKSKNKN